MNNLGLYCLVTSNPCGTDTWRADYECRCANCQTYLAHKRAIAPPPSQEPSPVDAGEADRAWDDFEPQQAPYTLAARHEAFLAGFAAGRASAKADHAKECAELIATVQKQIGHPQLAHLFRDSAIALDKLAELVKR